MYNKVNVRKCRLHSVTITHITDKISHARRIKHLLHLKLVDEVIPEPLGGAQYDPPAVADSIRATLLRRLQTLRTMSDDTRLNARYQRFRALGRYEEGVE